MSSPPDLDPLQYGWEMKGQELRPVFTPPGQLAAPDEVCSTSSVVVAKLDAKQHSVLVLNSTLPAQSFANVCKPTAKIQKRQHQTVTTVTMKNSMKNVVKNLHSPARKPPRIIIMTFSSNFPFEEVCTHAV